MKKLNIAKSNFLLNGITMPIGAAYGKFDLSYTYAHVTDKHGNTHTRRRIETDAITYFLCDFRPEYTTDEFGRTHANFNICVWNGKHWRYVNTGDSARYYKLGEFLYNTIRKYGRLGTHVNDTSHTYHPSVCNNTWAKSHKAIYRGVPGYATNPYITTDFEAKPFIENVNVKKFDGHF